MAISWAELGLRQSLRCLLCRFEGSAAGLARALRARREVRRMTLRGGIVAEWMLVGVGEGDVGY